MRRSAVKNAWALICRLQGDKQPLLQDGLVLCVFFSWGAGGAGDGLKAALLMSGGCEYKESNCEYKSAEIYPRLSVILVNISYLSFFVCALDDFLL